MLSIERVEGVLNAFLGLFTQPFDQDLKASVSAAASSICLAALLPAQGLSFLTPHGTQTALELSGVSLVLVLVWMAATAILSPAASRKVSIARNLSVVSFWIAVTLVLVLGVELVFPSPLDRAIRLYSAWAMLVILVPTHMFRNLRVGSACSMTFVLLLSNCALAYVVIY